MDTADVKMPGGLASPTVADASDEALTDCRETDMELLVDLLEEMGSKPADDGSIPAGVLEEQPIADRGNVSAAERSSRRIQAIDQELAEREQQRQEQRTAELEAARAQLEAALADAPKHLKALNDHAAEVEPARQRIEQFVEDVHAVAGAVRLEDSIDRTRDAAQTAAAALGKKSPKLPAKPDSMPTHGEADALLAVLSGLRGGADSTVPKPPASVSGIDTAAEKYREE